MKIASYNSHRSAPFLRALVAKNNQVYSLEGSRRSYPISVPAGILGARKQLQSKVTPATETNHRLFFDAGFWRASLALSSFLPVRCRRGRQRYLQSSHSGAHENKFDPDPRNASGSSIVKRALLAGSSANPASSSVSPTTAIRSGV